MKVLIPIVIGLLVVGCGKTELTPEQKATLRDNVVGEYEWKNTMKLVFQENGTVEHYYKGKKDAEDEWTISNGEIVVKTDPRSRVFFRINTDKSITGVAMIRDGKRTDMPKESQPTYIKIK